MMIQNLPTLTDQAALNADAELSVPLASRELADCDNETLWAQIPRWVKVRLDVRDVVTMRDGLMFAWGPRGGRVRKTTVKLAGDDTYSIEFGYLNRRTYAYVVSETAEGIYCDALGETLEEMASTVLHS
jgi:hypothetical protein